MTLFYDDSVSLRTFQFPIFGITTDRDLIWIIFPFLGILGYYLVWLALQRVKSHFQYIAQENTTEANRLRLLLSTQMLTSPLNDESDDFDTFYRSIWKVLALSVFFAPIVVTLLAILDQLNWIAIIRGDYGAHTTDSWSTVSILRLILELFLLMFQIALLWKVVGVARALGRRQSEVQLAINVLGPV